MICTSDLEKLQKRSAGQFNILHLTTIFKISRNDDLPPGIHAKNSLNSPYLLMFSPFFTVDGLHLPWSSTGLNDDLRPRHISREAVFIQQCLSPWFSFTWFHVQGLQQHSSLSFFTEFQPQSESGIPPEYPKERMIPIGCQVDQKIFQSYHSSIFIILFQFIYSFWIFCRK